MIDRHEMNDWRRFELLVSRIEAALVPKGATVRSPDRISDKVTGQLREVDASIRLQVGTTPILITVECRDRVAIQDDTWIEQIAKKKEKIGASATIAVSSRGFTEPASISARHYGIELRTLTDVTGTDAASWTDDVQVSIEFREWRFTRLEVVLLNAPPSVVLASSLEDAIRSQGYNAAVAFRKGDGHALILGEVGGQFVEHGLYPAIPGVRPFGVVRPADGEYLVPTDCGDFPLSEIRLEVEVSNVSRPIPLKKAFEYANQTGPLVQAAEYEFRSPIGSLTVGVIRSPEVSPDAP
jgi:hypothetical protein